jgi:predicted ATP-grasp superfamily ATP-dependent carboligase
VSGSVLIAGFATRHVARSAKNAGYRVYAVDHFCDQDLYWYVEDAIRFDDLEDLPDAIQEMCAQHRIDMLVTTSGAETVSSPAPVCGTKPGAVDPFLDKLYLQHFFEDLGIPVPPLARPGQYPVMVKPRKGAGGWRNAIVSSITEMDEWNLASENAPAICQEVVQGIPSSVCCIGDGHCARAVAVNEQILRCIEGAQFGFCGSITPFEHPARDLMVSWAEQAVQASGCVGTIGVDFVAGEQAYAIEINPRFQATVDSIEMASGCNLFALHVGACQGILPSGPLPMRQTAVRTILFADRDREITEDLTRLAPAVADIPWPGTSFEEGMAVVSVFGWGPDRVHALRVLDKNITTVRQYIR